jgi:hypothetical protein
MNAGSGSNLQWFWDFDKRMTTPPAFSPCQALAWVGERKNTEFAFIEVCPLKNLSP